MDLKSQKLWKYLMEGFKEKSSYDLAQKLALNLLDICKEASDRIKEVRSSFPEYTLHDEVHFTKVVNIMGKIIPSKVLKKLNPVELFLLISSAYFHDQGMVISGEEYKEIAKTQDFIISLRNWEIKYPSYTELKINVKKTYITETQIKECQSKIVEHEKGHLINYIRSQHGLRSAEFVRMQYKSDPRWKIQNINVADLTAKLCLSHSLNANELIKNNRFNYEETVGSFNVNMVYLSLILRLADILDFDRDRTPDIIFKTIKFSSTISLIEWHKHLSVYGHRITPNRIMYKCLSESPEYEKSIRDFIKWINKELVRAHSIIKLFPSEINYYKLDLPLLVDDSQIGPKDNSYIYKDLNFSLSHQEIIKLFMTDNLYKRKWLCIRELIQNSLDALEHRKILYKCDLNVDWNDGKIELIHYLNNEGYEIVECYDNGIGMDIPIIEKFLTKVGLSYYSSPEFKSEKRRFEERGFKFEPNALFGIGFLSCFMLGDQIEILTRRTYGAEIKKGPPLLIEINGLSGLLIIRNGEENQEVGTRVKIICRDKEILYHPYTDKIKLIDAVEGYMIAVKFPITAICEIPNLENKVKIPASISIPLTELEYHKISPIITIKQDFNEESQNLEGLIKISLLIDEDGNLVLKNKEAEWDIDDKGNLKIFKRNNTLNEDIGYKFHKTITRTCFDGILVCGVPGRKYKEYLIGERTNMVYLGRVHFTLNVKGSLKAPLHTDRHPPVRYYDISPEWKHISELAEIACGRLWEKILNMIQNSQEEIFWSLILIYDAKITWMRIGKLWEKLSLPFKNENNKYLWIKISDLESLKFKIINHSWRFENKDGNILSAPDFFDHWSDTQRLEDNQLKLQRIVLSLGTLMIENDEPILKLDVPDNDELVPNEYLITVEHDFRYYIPYSEDLAHIVSVELPVLHSNYRDFTVNRNHKLAEIVFKTKSLKNLLEIEKFARTATTCLSDPRTFNILKNPKEKLHLYLVFFAKLYLNLRDALPEDLRAPYYIWLKDKGNTEITEELIKEWAEVDLKSID